MNFVLRVIAIFIAVGVAVWLVPGVDIIGTQDTWAALVIVAVVIALLNMTIKPILQIIGLPITILSLGIFYLVINTVLLYLAAGISSGLFGVGIAIETFGSGFIASIVISLVSTFMNSLLGTNDQ